MGAYRLNNVLSNKNAKVLYSALVELMLNYGVTVWGGALRYLIESLEKSQKCVIANLTRTGRADDTDYRMMEVFRVSALYRYRMLTRNYYNKEYRQKQQMEYNTMAYRIRCVEPGTNMETERDV